MPWEQGDFHGRHVAAESSSSVSIEWELIPPRELEKRVRVCDYTCDCRPVIYELCQRGGLRCIRRTTRKDGRVVVEESALRVASEVKALWDHLLTGGAQ